MESTQQDLPPTQDVEPSEAWKNVPRVRAALHSDNNQWLPLLAHEGDACFDLMARSFAHPDDLDREYDSVAIAPGGRVLARTGVFLEIPYGWEAQVRSRSGLALKQGVTVLNTPGTIDSGYRNEVGVILINTDQHRPASFKAGDRVAQIAFRPIHAHAVEMIQMDQFNKNTERGEGGFGSTGV